MARHALARARGQLGTRRAFERRHMLFEVCREWSGHEVRRITAGERPEMSARGGQVFRRLPRKSFIPHGCLKLVIVLQKLNPLQQSLRTSGRRTTEARTPRELRRVATGSRPCARASSPTHKLRSKVAGPYRWPVTDLLWKSTLLHNSLSSLLWPCY